MDGHWCLCRNALKDDDGFASFDNAFAVDLDSVGGKKDVTGFCRNGAMPLMFQEKMRRVFGSSGGRGAGVFAGAVCWDAVAVLEPVLRSFVGGGLISRFIVE